MRAWYGVLASLAFCGATALAGEHDKAIGAQWTWLATRSSSGAGDLLDIAFHADLPAGWILYSSDFTADLGPRPASFKFEESSSYAPLGPVRAAHSRHRVDKTWGTTYTYFEKAAEFHQTIRLLTVTDRIAGHIDGQPPVEN